ncbi:metallophosphoesterase family protein [Fundidesulfovibrio terrae]|uniref:metallophosphoesterase family protein n=1 Tax=Fundidesulfovibrio terrae TaxID=2922866 RepID=UPI001FAF2AFC|nr:metallophosphoesterase family protein [Fundidesulfovibrio terrae]
MRLIVLSDIHGNLEALLAVLADARRVAPGAAIVCLGDVVGYGADPEAAARMVMESGAACVMGNHEMGVTDLRSRSRFNPQAWDSVLWARSRLSPETRRWMAGLPASLSLEGCRFVHGLPPDEVDTYLFQASAAKAVQAMEGIAEDVCFVGHTHQLRLVRVENGRLSGGRLEEGVSRLAPTVKYIVNAGAVGQPRDGNPKAKYCLYEPASRELVVRFVDYDAQAAADKIIASGQPRVYADRLTQGAS